MHQNQLDYYFSDLAIFDSPSNTCFGIGEILDIPYKKDSLAVGKVILTVKSSIFSTLTGFSPTNKYCLDGEFCFSSKTVLNVNKTSSAVIGFPSCHFKLDFNFIVNSLLSLKSTFLLNNLLNFLFHKYKEEHKLYLMQESLL